MTMTVAPFEASPTKFSLILQEITEHPDGDILRSLQIIENEFQPDYENDSGMGVGTPLDQRANDYGQALNKLSAFAKQKDLPDTTRTALANWLLDQFRGGRLELVDIIDALIHATPTKCLRGGGDTYIKIFERDKIPIQLVYELAYHYLTEDPSSYDKEKTKFTIKLAEYFDPNELLAFLTNKPNVMTREGIQLTLDRLASMRTLIGEKIVIQYAILEMMRNWDRGLEDLSGEEQKMTIALVVKSYFQNRTFTQSNYPSVPSEAVNRIHANFISAVKETRNILESHSQTIPARVHRRIRTASERWTRNVRCYYRKCAIAQYLYENGHLDTVANSLGVVNGQALVNIIRDQLRLTQTKLQNLYALLPKPHSRSTFCKSAGCFLLSFVLMGLCLSLTISNQRERSPLVMIVGVIGLVFACGSASYLRGIINENAARSMWTLPNEEVFRQFISTAQCLEEIETSGASYASVSSEREDEGSDRTLLARKVRSLPELTSRGGEVTPLPLPPILSVPALICQANTMMRSSPELLDDSNEEGNESLSAVNPRMV